MYQKYLSTFTKQLSIELNCSPEDFFASNDVLTTAAENAGRRVYISKCPFFQMVTFGGNSVITADPSLHDFLHEMLENTHSHWLFELHSLMKINAELERRGYTLTQTHHMFLPCREVQVTPDFPVKWFFGEDIMPFYAEKRFAHALCPEFDPNRPDRIAVCAYDGDRIMGMAGCSEDAPHLLQIGIDVFPEYRSKGVGKTLVTLLKNKIIELGETPFYGAAVGNYHSQKIALASGFKPSWIDIDCKKI